MPAEPSRGFNVAATLAAALANTEGRIVYVERVARSSCT